MKAGALTPATLEQRVSKTKGTSSLNEGGGSHPRNACGMAFPIVRPSGPLNEGGGSHPRNAAKVATIDDTAEARSMKAGALTPATPVLVRPHHATFSLAQ